MRPDVALCSACKRELPVALLRWCAADDRRRCRPCRSAHLEHQRASNERAERLAGPVAKVGTQGVMGL